MILYLYNHRSGNHDVLVDALIEVIGVELRIQAVVSKETDEATPSPAQQRPTGQSPASVATPSSPQANAPSARPKETEAADVEIATDDVELVNADEAAAALLAETFDARVIDVEEKHTP